MKKQKLICVFWAALLFSVGVFTLTAYGNSVVDSPIVQKGATTQGKDQTGAQTNKQNDRPRVLTKWLHMLDTNENAGIESSSVLAFAPQVPGDLGRVFKNIDGQRSSGGFWHALFLVIVSIAFGFLVVLGVKRIAVRGIAKLEQISPPAGDGISCLWAGCIRCIPSLAGMVVLALSSTLLFLLLAKNVASEGRMLFQFILGIVLIIKICSLFGKVIFAPEDVKVRPLSLNDSVAKALYRATAISTAVVLSGRMLVKFIIDLGALEQSVSWVAIVIGTTILAILGSLVIYLKTPISESLQGSSEKEKGWIKEQLTVYWHIPALLYLFFAWFIWIGQELSGTVIRNGSFLVSLFIVPIYLVLSYAGRAVIRSVIDSLGVGAIVDPDSSNQEDGTATVAVQVAIDRKKEIESKSYSIFRIILVTVISIWTLTLWGYDIPFAANAIRAVFESLITLALALLVWKVASTYIARKIKEATPEPAENADDDNEFGGSVPASRSHTLLPMLRKVLASTLIVMVSLIILSSLGVNIAPILAGAGVLGLAVGFGAQKLVSDVLSGFFFLLDDAFRVGEYIEAGSTKGSVETITLRNVMLRHHRGMLQIVPHSDLGAITNYMRGGMVIKFPLEFAYDVDIDKVRKIIKKVGQTMLEDEEMRDAFIQPLKSQGVNEIANSVMIIRVKFTAKPGKQFTIKREAFRLITEALNASGIHYAHRKVIVDFPDDGHRGVIDEDTRKKALEAGAAAVIAADAEQQLKQAALVQEK